MGFEVVVRPAILPDIRPPPAQALLPADAPDKGIAVISGGGGGVIDLPWSQNSSWSRSRNVEVIRHYAKVRVYASQQDGTYDKSTYIEYEVLTSIEYRENGKDVSKFTYAKPTDSPDGSYEIIETGLSRMNVENL
jgi:hypothetical protein